MDMENKNEKLQCIDPEFIRDTTLNLKITESVEIENGVVKMCGVYIPYLNPKNLNNDDFCQ